MILFLRGLDLFSPTTHFLLLSRNVQNSFVSVFILFTMDHWYELLQDTWKVPEVSRLFSSIYIILWIILGAIVFRNIIVAMMGKSRRGEKTWWEGSCKDISVKNKIGIFWIKGTCVNREVWNLNVYFTWFLPTKALSSGLFTTIS